MQLTIYRLCDESQHNPELEEAMRLQWADAPPTVGQLVGMGCDTRYEIVHVYGFEPAEDAPVEAVHIAFVELPGSQIEPENWSCWKYKDVTPEENVFVHLEAVGLPPLSYGFNCLNEPPELGERLLAGVPVEEDSTQLKLVPQPWEVEQIVAYEPVGESPCTAVYLTWCRAFSRSLTVA